MNNMSGQFHFDEAGRIIAPGDVQQSIRNLACSAKTYLVRTGLRQTPERVERSWHAYYRRFNKEPFSGQRHGFELERTARLERS